MIATEIDEPVAHGVRREEPRARFFATRTANGDEKVFATIAGEIVGVVRLLRQDDAVELCGVQVAEAWRGRGLGARLLAAVASWTAGTTTFCIALTHLEDFYARAGWLRADDAAVPAAVTTRAERFRAAGDRVFVARRRCVSP